MKSTLRLFRALPVKYKRKKKASKQLLEETIKRGFVFSPEIVSNYTEKELLSLTRNIGLTPEQINSSFHKSWRKIKEASLAQLVIEQLIHYFTTYGFKKLGIYSEESVYIPKESLELPELRDDIQLTVIKGYTTAELKDKLLKMVGSGVALHTDTMQDILEIFEFVGINKRQLKGVKNREVKIALYDRFDLVPEDPTEFLRYAIYKSTGKTLLIKNKATIETIKESNRKGIVKLFRNYQKEYGLEKLAQIFYRFKPLFLAFKANTSLKKCINKIRKLAKKHHQPMPKDFLNSITAIIGRGERIKHEQLNKALSQVNIFRKIRLAYALKYRTKDVDSILYRIRNGKGFATDFSFNRKEYAKRILDFVLMSVTKDLKGTVKGKKIFIPEGITYSLPATEKQFTGYLPSGTYITIPKDMIFGIHWDNAGGYGIDLDLSLISPTSGKIGWDRSHRTDDRSILFSGDMTDAANGATELFYVRRQKKGAYIMLVNFYSYKADVDVPYQIIVAQEQASNFGNNYMINPNNIKARTFSKINTKQKILGLFVTTTDECRFYFAETNIGLDITSSDNAYTEHSRKYLFKFYEHSISLNAILEKAGAKLVKHKVNCDIDLSPETLEKDTILSLLSNRGGVAQFGRAAG